MDIGGSKQNSSRNKSIRCGAVRLRAVAHGLPTETSAHCIAEDEDSPRHQPTKPRKQ